MNLSSDALVLRMTHEVITNFASLYELDKKSMKFLPNICEISIPTIDVHASNNIGFEAAVSGGNVSSISVSRLDAAVNASKYCGSIERVMRNHNMIYSTVLSTFKIDHEAGLYAKDEAEPKVPIINDRDKDRKIIRLSTMFKEYLARSHGSLEPLSYVHREDSAVLDEIMYPLLANCYHGEIGRLISEL